MYKRGKGSVSRGVSIAALGAIALFGCRELCFFLLDMGLGPVSLPMAGEVKWAYIVTGVLGLSCGLGIFLLLNNHKVVDFLIETEAELKKVSWSPPRQLFGNTVIVIVSVVFLGLFILCCDVVIDNLVRMILGIS